MRRASAPRWQLALGFMVVMILIGAGVWSVLSRGRPGGSATPLARGRQVYSTRCASCHGANLEGQPNWQQQQGGIFPAPPLDQTGPAWRRSDQWLFAIVRDGGQAMAPPGTVSGMPPFGGGLGDEDIQAVLAYIKSSWPPDIQATQQQLR
jgi:mono/diheme cytochrome c family protein